VYSGMIRRPEGAFFWLLLLTIRMRSVFSSWLSGGRVSMADKPTDLDQGTLGMLILKTLALEPMHLYGITVR
jgi:hypothetical protein